MKSQVAFLCHLPWKGAGAWWTRRAVKGSVHVWRWVKSNIGRASTPCNFCQAAVKQNPSLIKSKLHLKREETEAYWQAIIPVPNTHRIHCVVPISKHHLLVREVSASDEYTYMYV